MFRAGLLLDEYKRFDPDSLVTIVESIERARSDLGFVILEFQSFTRAATKSIDYGLMERTKNAAVMPVSYGRSDVGSWQAVLELSARDTLSNFAQGPVVFVVLSASKTIAGRDFSGAAYGYDRFPLVRFCAEYNVGPFFWRSRRPQ
jgi:mannose-1-phosphate guanylyltransferase